MTDFDGAPVVVNAPQVPVGLILPVQGRDGTSITIEDVVPTYADLPTDLGLADRGALYIVQTDTLGYVWSGVSWPADGDGVEIRGPQGVSVTSVSVSGSSLVFAFSDGPSQSVPVPALTQAASDAAAARADRLAAETARSGAETAKTGADSAKSAAQTAKTAAETAKTAAETARSGAETARTGAESAKDAAAASATAAAGSATAAAGSASTAGSAATTASGARDDATGARDAAQSHASTASAAATAASQDANDAEASRIAAEAAAAAAEGAGGVATTRQIATGAGLTGGGDLSANRTIELSAATQASLGAADTASQPGHVHTMEDITDLSDALTPILDAKQSKSERGQPNGYAPLNGSGILASVYLPSYVDDVLEYAALGAFPTTGETGKIYTAIDTNKAYRWSGSTYVEISPSPGSTDAVPEGATNKYFTDARARSAMAGQSPLGIGFVHTGDTTRKTGLGSNASGIDTLASTITKMRVRLATPDASGTTTVIVKKNGTAVAGMSVSITAPATTGVVTGSWVFAADDQLTVEITAIGATPGKGCIANLTGMC